MPEVESLAQSPSGQRQLRLMVALTELEPLDSDHQVDIDPLYKDAASWGLEAVTIDNDLEASKAKGWVRFWPDLGGIGTVVVDQPGIDAASAFKSLRNNPRRRAQEIRDAVLNWLYDQHLSGSHPSGVADFLTSSYGQYLGDPYTQEELSRASKWLQDEQYIDGIKTFGGGLARPNITTKGIRVIENEQSVNRALVSAGVTVNKVTISDSQGVNVAVASSNVTQSNTLTQGQIEQVERVLGSVRAMLNPMVLGVTEGVTTEAQIVANQVEEEIHSPAPSTSKVKALMLKLIDLAATGTVQGGVDALTVMMQQGITDM
jgi:hypothetical protein